MLEEVGRQRANRGPEGQLWPQWSDAQWAEAFSFLVSRRLHPYGGLHAWFQEGLTWPGGELAAPGDPAQLPQPMHASSSSLLPQFTGKHEGVEHDDLLFFVLSSQAAGANGERFTLRRKVCARMYGAP